MRRLATASGVTYIVAWIAGLLVATGGPKPNDSATKVTSYFAGHEHSAMLGHLLVDGVAGIALVGIAITILLFLRPAENQLARAGFAAALLAAATSLVQFILGITFTYKAAHGGSAKTVRDLFVALNDADTVKLVFLGAMIAAVSIAAHRSSLLPNWFAIYGLISAPLLAISGFAFPFDSGVLLASLDLTLLLLLAWVGIFTAEVARRASSSGVPGRAPVPST